MRILALPHVPVLQNRLYGSAEAARAAVTGTLDVWGCQGCGFLWNRAFDPALLVYDGTYENDQTCSPAFSAHIDDMMARILAAAPRDEAIDLVEVGCGQGNFLRRFAEVAGSRLRSAVGFDPAWRGESGTTDARIRFHRRPYDAAAVGCLERPATMVVSRHTIEHLSDRLGFLEALRAAAVSGRQPTVFLETPCADWILRTGAIQDLFYEHCSLFTATALSQALSRSGFAVRSIDTVFGGQYLWAEAVPAGEPSPADLRNRTAGGPEPRQCEPGPALDIDAFVGHWRTRLAGAGPIALWGAGAKGATFGLLVDPDCRLIDCVVDINPAKQGHYMPTAHSIVPPEEARRRGIRTVIVMNPNYAEEIAAHCRSIGFFPEHLVLEGGR